MAGRSSRELPGQAQELTWVLFSEGGWQGEGQQGHPLEILPGCQAFVGNGGQGLDPRQLRVYTGRQKPTWGSGNLHWVTSVVTLCLSGIMWRPAASLTLRFLSSLCSERPSPALTVFVKEALR